ncbi:MAG: DegV family protein, partial [Actinomycetales bacterium]|nr:DegV family protein [Actinomycetales bacterium]
MPGASVPDPSGSGPVAVVTDSTAYLSPDLVAEHGLTVVPLQVVVGGRARAEGIEVSSRTVAEALRGWTPVTTSRPAPAVFAETYRKLAAQGATRIVSVHLSGELSGTVSAARTAAEEVADVTRVEVVDSRMMAMGMGYAVLAAARTAAEGGDLASVARVAAEVAGATRGWVYVDTLEYLRRGGRVSTLQTLFGSALSVKPLLGLVDGRLELLERVRTASRALTRLEELVVAEAGAAPVDVTVHHLDAPERAERMAGRLESHLPGLRELNVIEVGAVVGAHVGPGMLAVAMAPAAPTP